MGASREQIAKEAADAIARLNYALNEIVEYTDLNKVLNNYHPAPIYPHILIKYPRNSNRRSATAEIDGKSSEHIFHQEQKHNSHIFSVKGVSEDRYLLIMR